MSLKSTFLALKKLVQVVQIGGNGGVGRGNLDKIQKNSYFFSGNLPLDHIDIKFEELVTNNTVRTTIILSKTFH